MCTIMTCCVFHLLKPARFFKKIYRTNSVYKSIFSNVQQDVISLKRDHHKSSTV